MSAEDEQLEEIEALEAIFPDCFTLISNTSPMEYKIKLLPGAEDDENHVGCTLICKIPADYPNDCCPEFSIQMDKGLNKNHIEQISELANSTASDNMGAPIVFLVAEAVIEWLAAHNTRKDSFSARPCNCQYGLTSSYNFV